MRLRVLFCVLGIELCLGYQYKKESQNESPCCSKVLPTRYIFFAGRAHISCRQLAPLARTYIL